MVPADDPGLRSLVVVRVRGPLDSGEVSQVCARVQSLLDAGDAVGIRCDVPGAADLGAVHAVARLELVARRNGIKLVVRATKEFRGLLALTGLHAVVPEPLAMAADPPPQ